MHTKWNGYRTLSRAINVKRQPITNLHISATTHLTLNQQWLAEAGPHHTPYLLNHHVDHPPRAQTPLPLHPLNSPSNMPRQGHALRNGHE